MQDFPLRIAFVAGAKFHKGIEYASKMADGDQLALVPELDNSHDKNSLAIYCGSVKLGYVSRMDNEQVAEWLKHEAPVKCRLHKVDRSQASYKMFKYEVYLDLQELLDEVCRNFDLMKLRDLQELRS